MSTDTDYEFAILLVDDHPANLRVLLDALKNSGWKTFVAVNGEGAIRQAKLTQPDLILLDVMMPGMDGFETCRRLKQQQSTREIPVIFMTALSETINKLKGFDAGGVDYLTKPFEIRELVARVQVHLDLKRAQDKLAQKNEELQRVNEQLLSYQQQLEHAAHTDPLTKLLNRRAIMTELRKEHQRVDRYQRPFSLLLGDIDHFKQFNDRFGHDCGDMVLVETANLLRRTIRAQDNVGRWGGEEFLLLLPETGEEGAVLMAERLRTALEHHRFEYQERSLSITMTFGLRVIEEKSLGVELALKHADQALYQGKEMGRNRVVLFTGCKI